MLKKNRTFQKYIEALYETFDESKALSRAGLTQESLSQAIDLDSELKAARDTFFANYKELLRQKVGMLGASYLVKALSSGITTTQTQRVVKTLDDGTEIVTESMTITSAPPPSDLVRYALMQSQSESPENQENPRDSLIEASIQMLLQS